MFWVLGVIALVALAAAIAMQVAIARNGPAVLDSVDRIVGGGRGAAQQAVVSTGPHSAQKLVIWGPERPDPARAPLPVLLFVHGGSWRYGDPLDYGFIGRSFVPEGFVVVLVGYRLGVDGIYPAMIEDTASAVEWTRAEIGKFGGDPDRIVLAGHSAGAYNVAMTALEERWLGHKGISTKGISGVVGLAGPYDFAPFDSDSTIAAFGHADDPQATQPISHTRADAPPMLLIHGERDTLVYPRNTRALTLGIERSGGSARSVFYPEMEHNDPLLSLAAPWRSRRDLVRTIADFAREATSAPSEASQTSVPVHGETG